MTRLNYTDVFKHLSSKRSWAACLQRPVHEWLSLQQDSIACLGLCRYPGWDKPLPDLSSLSHWQKVPGDPLLKYQSTNDIPHSFSHHEVPQDRDLAVTSYRNQQLLLHQHGWCVAGLEHLYMSECHKWDAAWWKVGPSVFLLPLAKQRSIKNKTKPNRKLSGKHPSPSLQSSQIM